MRNFTDKDTLGIIEERLVYLEERLLADDETQDLAPSVGSLVQRVDAIRAEMRAAKYDGVRAQARVDACDAELDDHVDALAAALRGLFGDRDGARFRRYFKRDVEDVVRLGLASQLAVGKDWPALLKQESEPALQAGAQAISASIADGELAIAARTSAAVRMATIRVERLLSSASGTSTWPAARTASHTTGSACTRSCAARRARNRT